MDDKAVKLVVDPVERKKRIESMNWTHGFIHTSQTHIWSLCENYMQTEDAITGGILGMFEAAINISIWDKTKMKIGLIPQIRSTV